MTIFMPQEIITKGESRLIVLHRISRAIKEN